MLVSEAKYRVLATTKERRGAHSSEKKWHEVEASDQKEALIRIGRLAKHVTIHHVHNMDDAEGRRLHSNAINKVHDIPRNLTPAFTDDERKTLFGRAKAALGIKKKKNTLPTFGGTIKRK